MVVDQLAVSCRYVSCAELGGDLCDYVAIGPGRIALLVADVMGHGVSAAMLTGVVKSAFRASSPQGLRTAGDGPAGSGATWMRSDRSGS